MSLPRVLILGLLKFAEDKVSELLDDIAEVIRVDATNRAEFFAGLQPSGKYAGAVGLYRHWDSAAVTGPFDKELIDKLSTSVKWIAGTAVGYEMIDIAACKEHGILYSNTPGSVDVSTATTALYLIISTMRHFSKADRDLHAGKWKHGHKAAGLHDLEGHTLAILGLGDIGLHLATFVRPFGMRVVYHNRKPNPDAPEWCEYFPAERLDEMLALTDVLSVHIPLRTETIGFVGERMIRKLKKGAIIVNTARGKIIDEDAMIRALDDGHLAGIGLDVYPNEPEVNPRLLEFPNAALLPHMGGDSADAQRKLETRALVAARDYLTTGTSKDVVPELR
ncbi:D-isomer specific 2-hydroxyacid dehydrogenase [Amylocystis lapponica]|nr:D-isomer specific 2-hydroxyacid dehydrogenase [Amylocystis lapponica]